MNDMRRSRMEPGSGKTPTVNAMATIYGMTRIVGIQDRSEFILDPQQALRRGRCRIACSALPRFLQHAASCERPTA